MMAASEAVAAGDDLSGHRTLSSSERRLIGGNAFCASRC